MIKAESFYDGLGRTTETRNYETSSNFVKTLTEYDNLGRAYKSSNPFRPYLSETAQYTTSTFDDLGRVIQVKTPDNATVTRSYSGSSVTVTDQAGNSRSGISDAIGRLLKVTEFDGSSQYDSLYAYDVLGRLRRTAQTSGSVTQNRYFMYNDLGRLLRAKQVEQTANSALNTTDPVTGNTSWSVGYTYDDNGNISTTTDALNRTITGTYDTLNRLTMRDYSDSTADVSFTYDDVNIANSKGQLTKVDSTVSTTNYTAFDILGRIKSSSQRTGTETYAMPDYSYDLSGALVSQTYPSNRVVTTETDDLGRLSAIKSQLPNDVQKTMLSQLAYTSFGAVKQAKLGNGKWESAQFDSQRLQITQIGLGSSAVDTSLLKINYEYGALNLGTGQVTAGTNNGNLAKQTIAVPTAVNGPAFTATQYYAYDGLNRLKTATENVTPQNQSAQLSWRQQFNYDRFGNRRFDATNTTTLGSCSQTVCNPNVDLATNRFNSTDGYGYDSEGSLTSNPESQSFSYDAENRLVQEQNSSTQTSANYSYDGSGKRVKKTVGTDETIFVYDAFGKLIAEYAATIDNRPKATNYLTADNLGSPRVITDQLGHVVSRHDYMPFGEEVLSGIGGRTTTQGYGGDDGVRQKFTGYERDVETGLDFAQNRYYSGKHGRFTSVDPLAASANIKAPQSLNRYSYGNNSPYKFTDPLGLAAQCQGPGGANNVTTLSSCDGASNSGVDDPPIPIPLPPIGSSMAGSSEYQEWIANGGTYDTSTSDISPTDDLEDDLGNVEIVFDMRDVVEDSVENFSDDTPNQVYRQTYYSKVFYAVAINKKTRERLTGVSFESDSDNISGRPGEGMADQYGQMDLGAAVAGGSKDIRKPQADISLSNEIDPSEKPEKFSGTVTVYNQDRSQSIKATFKGTYIIGNHAISGTIDSVDKQVHSRTDIKISP